MTREKRMVEGAQFGMLTLIKFHSKTPYNQGMYLCMCSCGQKRIALGMSLALKHVRSCGKEQCIPDKVGDSIAYDPTYATWRMMRRRCRTTNDHNYFYYAKKGITVDPRWDASYEAFKQDMGERPPYKELDRIDTTKGYYKENCRWITHADNIKNRLKYKKKTKEQKEAERKELEKLCTQV